MNTTVAILQARMSSRRLPGKVLKALCGEPMLRQQIKRLQRAVLVDRLVVATSANSDDEPIAELCSSMGIDCFRGSLDDVLDRYYQCAQPYEAKHIVRLTGDCPLADPAVIDRVIDEHHKNGADYTSNTLVRTWPQGLDVEAVKISALTEAWGNSSLPSEREHVTLHIWKRPDTFQLHSVENFPDHSDLRWTVDEPADFEFVQKVYEQLFPINQDFSTEDILQLIKKNPELALINEKVDREAGLRKSLEEDRTYLGQNARNTPS